MRQTLSGKRQGCFVSNFVLRISNFPSLGAMPRGKSDSAAMREDTQGYGQELSGNMLEWGAITQKFYMINSKHEIRNSKFETNSNDLIIQ